MHLFENSCCIPHRICYVLNRQRGNRPASSPLGPSRVTKPVNRSMNAENFSPEPEEMSDEEILFRELADNWEAQGSVAMWEEDEFGELEEAPEW
jgi:hypothetical protein